MKRFYLMPAVAALLLASCTAATSDTSAPEDIKPWDRQAMSTYIYISGKQPVDSAFVSAIDFENFDNVYLMGREVWAQQTDFDRAADSILSDKNSFYPLDHPEIFSYAVDEAHKAGTKALITFGSEVMFGADSVNRPKLVKILTDVMESVDADGIDIDWEAGLYPDNYESHRLLLETLRTSLDSLGAAKNRQYYLSTAIAVRPGIYPEELLARMGKAVDIINLMSYDLGGGIWSSAASHNTPYEVIAEAVDTRWNMVPREKLHLGLASYGFQYEGLLPEEEIPAGATMSDIGKYVNYSTVVPYIYNNRAWRAEYDASQRVYYFINDAKKGFISIETPETLMHKYQLAADRGLGGTFWWEYHKDIVPDKTGSGKWVHTLVPPHKRRESYK